LPTSSEVALLDQISEGPYYSLRIVPAAPRRKSLAEMRAIVSDNAVSIRGWDFPHARDPETYTGDAYVFGVIDWDRHRELWRAYPSGQFLYIGSVWDIYPHTQVRLMDEIRSQVVIASDAQKQSVSGAISFVGIIYAVTEFYIFAARLSSSIEAAGLIRIQVVLHNVEGWALASGEPSVIWHSFRQAQVPRISSDREIAATTLVGDPLGSGRVAIREILEKFNWHDVSDRTIGDWQEKIAKGRF
jgi:hypothetical protein